jgi:hypothetical protein
MSTIQRIGLSDFERLLEQWRPLRRITEFHLHCTDRPRHADFRGMASIEAMRNYHLSKGWSDIAQHLTVDPAGGLWTGRDWDRSPASAVGHNGSSSAGPFMIETVGLFDKGYDEFKAPQKTAVLGVIVAVLRKFGLSETALRFHNEFTNGKSCPGNAIDLNKMRAEVKALLTGTESLVLPPVSDATLGTAEVRAWFDGSSGARGVADPSYEDPQFAEVPEDDWMLAEQEALAAHLDSGAAARATRAPLPSHDPLRRHVINLSKGLLSTRGDIDSVIVTPRSVIEKHFVDYLRLRQAQNLPAHLVLYAHGGLVDEGTAVCYANTVLKWWLDQGVFPIFFIWESGLFETLRQTPRGTRGWFGDLTDRLVEGLTQAAARRVWAEMKDDALNASKPALAQYEGRAGGAWQLAELLRPVLASYPETKVHAIGHSTGPIFLSRFLPLITDHGPMVDTLSYLAPAIRTDRFITEVKPLIGEKIRDLCVYTMTDDAERDDTVTKVYRKSLLYFVREACEDRDDGRILGLQRDMFSDPTLRRLFGLPAKFNPRVVSYSNGPCAVEFSPAFGAESMNERTAALQHGGFDNDAKTMVSVLARILGSAPTINSTAMQFPSPAQFKKCGMEDGSRAAPITIDDVGSYGCRCCRAQVDLGMPSDGRDGFGDDDESGGGISDVRDREEEEPDLGGDVPVPGHGGRSRRVAVCVGIDKYKSQPLDGCVADSKQWASALQSQGFDVTRLENSRATYVGIKAAMEKLVVAAKPGDELVFQYSGHGSWVANPAGSEKDKREELIVPYDYDTGRMLADDEVHDITRQLPPGATLTLFMDCCHSGSNSRAQIQATQAKVGARSKPRVMMLDKTTVALYESQRARRRTNARATNEAGPGPGVVHFAACQDDEYAWESDGQGDFTRAAMTLFARARKEAWSNQRFIDAVIVALRQPRRQQPLIYDPAPGLGTRDFLGDQ